MFREVLAVGTAALFLSCFPNISSSPLSCRHGAGSPLRGDGERPLFTIDAAGASAGNGEK